MSDLERAARRVLEMLDDHSIRAFMGEDALDRIADLRAALDEDQITSLNQITSLPIKVTEETTIENAVPLKYDDRLMANKEKSEYWYWW